MAAAKVQEVKTAFSSTATCTSTVTSTTQNNLVVVGVYILDTTNNVQVTSMSDSAGNTYAVSAMIEVSGGKFKSYIGYGVQVTGGSTTVTVTLDSSGYVANGCVALIAEFSGTKTTNASTYDTTTTGTANSGTIAVATLTPAATGELIVAMIGRDTGTGGVITAGSGYTGFTHSSYADRVLFQYKLSGASTETAPASAFSDNWVERAIAFKLASNIKTFNGLANASTSTVNGLANASVKTKNGLAQ